MPETTVAITYVPVDQLRPYERNPRRNDQAVHAVAESIKQYGFLVPIVADADGTIVAGHTRWKAAKKLKLSQVPVIMAGHLTPDQIKAFRLADNKLNELADWDEALLSEELAGLCNAGYDISLLGFDPQELSLLLKRPRKAIINPDTVPEMPQTPRSSTGTLWLLGQHRLLCGDAANSRHVDQLMDGALCDMVHTDPPYNSQTLPRSKNALIAAAADTIESQKSLVKRIAVAEPERLASPNTPVLRSRDLPVIGDYMSAGEYEQFTQQWLTNVCSVMKSGAPFYVWFGSNISVLAMLAQVCTSLNMHIAQQLVWYKQQQTAAFSVDYQHNYEICVYGWKRGAQHQFYGRHGQDDVWVFKKPSGAERLHATQKPVAVAEKAIGNSSLPGQIVVDLFGGSGTTLIACEQLERICYMMEVSPLLCDVIVDRWERLTGGKATMVNHVESNQNV